MAEMIRQPTAGFETDPALGQIAQEMVSTSGAPVPTFTDILYGDVTRIGGEEIPQVTIEAARKNPNSEQAQFIRDQIDYQAAMQQSQSRGVRMAGTVVDPRTGVVSPGIPKEFEGRLTEKQEEELTEYGGRSLRLQQALAPYIQDKRVRQIMADTYGTGEWFTETARETSQFASDVGGTVLNAGYYLAMMGTAAVDAAFDENREYKEVWETDYKADTVKSLASWKQFIETKVGTADHARSVNKRVKEKFIEQYGQAEYDKLTKLQIGDAPAVEGQLIPDELGQVLLDLGTSELSLPEQVLKLLYETAPVAGPVAVMHMASGNKKLKKVADAAEVMPALKGMDPVMAYRTLRLTESKRMFSRGVSRVLNKVGDTLGYRGSIGNVLEVRSHKAASKKLDDEITSVRAELDNAKIGGAKETDLKRLQVQLDSLMGRRNRLRVKGGFFLKNPYAFTFAVDESIIATGQVIGTNVAENFGYDKDLGGLFGALGFAFLGRPAVKLPGATLSAVDKVAFGGRGSQIGVDMIRHIEDMAKIVPIVKDRPELVKGFLRSSQFDFIEAELNRKLLPSEVASFRAVADIMKNLPDDQRETVFNSMVDYVALKGRLVNSYDEADRAKADELLTMTFGQISGLAPLQALEVTSLGRMRGQSFNDAVGAQLQQEQALVALDRNISQLRKMFEGKSGVDSEDTIFAQQFIDNMERAADQQRIQLGERKREYLGLLREYKDNVLSNPLEDVDSDDIIKQLVDMELSLTPGAIGNTEVERQILTQTIEDVQVAAAKRFKSLQDLVGTPAHRRLLGQTTELLYDAHISTQYAKGRQAYKIASEKIGDKRLDIAPFVEQFVQTSEDISQRDLGGLFAADADFFTGRSGKMALRAFNDMATRSLIKNLELDEEDLSELVEYVSVRKLADGSANPDFIEDVNPIKLALHFSKKEGAEFAPFEADAFEVDTIHRHFRNKGEYIRNDAQAKPYKDAAREINTLMMADKDIGPAINEARKTYKAEVFDIARPGTYGDKLDKATDNPRKERIEAGGYQRAYKIGQYPEEWHKDFAKNIGNAIDGKGVLPADIQLRMDEIQQFWADDFVDGKFVFDLTTEAGKAKFSGLQDMIRANLHEHWMTSRLDKAAGDMIMIADSPTAKLSGYDFTVTERIKALEEVLNVQVIEEVGDSPSSFNLLDMMEIMSEQNELENLMKVNKKLQGDWNKFTTNINNRIADEGDAAVDQINLDQRVIRKLEEAAITTDPQQFYKTYVENQNVTKLRSLRVNYLSNLDADVDIEKATQEFDDSVRYLIFNGLLETAQAAPLAKRTFSGNSGKATMTVMNNPEVLLKQLDSANVQEILELVGMDADHVRFMYDMTDMAMRAGGVAAIPFAPKGQIRGISPNEIISRSFNIARGMVSPTYVAAEFAFRLMQQNGMSGLQLAAGNKQAAEIMVKMMDIPEDISEDDVRTLMSIAQTFIVQEGYRRGITFATDFLPSEDISAAQMQTGTETNENVQ